VHSDEPSSSTSSTDLLTYLPFANVILRTWKNSIETATSHGYIVLSTTCDLAQLPFSRNNLSNIVYISSSPWPKERTQGLLGYTRLISARVTTNATLRTSISLAEALSLLGSDHALLSDSSPNSRLPEEPQVTTHRLAGSTYSHVKTPVLSILNS
jgi:hypothetical protein